MLFAPRLFILFFLIIGLACHGIAQKSDLAMQGPAKVVFHKGEGGYACFRIPAIIHLSNKKLVAFAEGRIRGCSDTGDIDLVMKTSTDQGKTWSALSIIWDDGENTCGNPAPIVDTKTNAIYLLSTWNLGSDHERDIINQISQDTRRVFCLSSDDEGKTWGNPEEITSDVKLENWTWYATGPGSGIQIKKGRHSGRLILGCDHIEAESKKYFSHVIFSDDQGTTWQLGGSTPQDQVNECEVAELDGGQLMLNMRNYDRNQKMRQVAFSADGGLTWTNQHHDTALIEPICQASLHTHENLILFSNPSASDSRTNMTVKASQDNGKTWFLSTSLHSGPSAYSDLVSLDTHLIGCLFESGNENPYERIVFQRVMIP